MTKKKDSTLNFLNYEEADNLQDMINFAASMNTNEKGQNIYPIESLYSQVLNAKGNINAQVSMNIYTNEKIDNAIAELLKRNEMDDLTKINKLLELYSQLLNMKNKNLSETTYVGLVELFMKNGYLNHASYFLCQMDRLKMKIPRSLLDLFLDYSINNGIFDRKEREEIKFKNTQYDSDRVNNKGGSTIIEGEKDYGTNFNKYDQYDPQNQPEYAYYFSRRNLYKKRNDMEAILSNLRVDAKPFYPKSVEDEQLDKIKKKLSEIDTTKVKEFIPKQYRVVKKEEQNSTSVNNENSNK
jgi:hypothetical protein